MYFQVQECLAPETPSECDLERHLLIACKEIPIAGFELAKILRLSSVRP